MERQPERAHVVEPEGNAGTNKSFCVTVLYKKLDQRHFDLNYHPAMAKRARKQGGASEEATLAGEGSSAGPAAAARESTAAARHDEDTCKGEKRRAGAAASKSNEIDDIFASKPKQAKTATAEKAEKALGDSSKGRSQSAAVVTVDTSSLVRACGSVLWWLGLVCMRPNTG